MVSGVSEQTGKFYDFHHPGLGIGMGASFARSHEINPGSSLQCLEASPSSSAPHRYSAGACTLKAHVPSPIFRC